MIKITNEKQLENWNLWGFLLIAIYVSTRYLSNIDVVSILMNKSLQF